MSSFLENLEVPVPTTALDEVMSYVKKADQLSDRIQKGEVLLAALKKELESLTLKIIPEMMGKHGLDKMGLENGRLLDIKEKVFIKMPEEESKQRVFLRFLLDNNGGHMIKDTLTIESPPESIKEVLQEKAVPFETKVTVNGNSLTAWAKDVLGMKKGSIARLKVEDFPKEANLFIRREAVIK